MTFGELIKLTHLDKGLILQRNQELRLVVRKLIKLIVDLGELRGWVKVFGGDFNIKFFKKVKWCRIRVDSEIYIF